MVEMIDTPLKANTDRRPKWLVWLMIAIGELFLVAICLAGPAFIHVGEMGGMDIQAQFDNPDRVSSDGDYVYKKGSTIFYQVKIRNRGNESFSRVEIQSSFHSDGGSCNGQALTVGGRLPGATLSPLFSTPLSSGKDYIYNATYEIPATMCPSGAHLKIFVQANLRAGGKSASFICPAHIRVE